MFGETNVQICSDCLFVRKSAFETLLRPLSPKTFIDLGEANVQICSDCVFVRKSAFETLLRPLSSKTSIDRGETNVQICSDCLFVRKIAFETLLRPLSPKTSIDAQNLKAQCRYSTSPRDVHSGRLILCRRQLLVASDQHSLRFHPDSALHVV